MAVSLEYTDLMQPKGELDEYLLPQGDIASLVQEALAQAKVRVESNTNIAPVLHDDAARAWVYGHVYGIVASRMAAQPSMIVVAQQVTRMINADRIQYFKRLSEQYMEEYERYATNEQRMPLRSRRASIVATW